MFPLSIVEDTLKLAIYDPTRKETVEFLDRKVGNWEYVVVERSIVLDGINQQFPIASSNASFKKQE